MLGVLFKILIWFILLLFSSYCTCIEEYTGSEKILNTISKEDLKYVAIQECGPSSFGTCAVWIYEYSNRNVLTKLGDPFIKCGSAFHNVDFAFLDDRFLLVKLFTGAWGVSDPNIIVPLRRSSKLLHITVRDVIGHWERIEYIDNHQFAAELYLSPDNEGSYGIHIWQRESPKDNRNILIIDSKIVDFEFIGDNIVNIKINMKDNQEIDLFFLLWEGRYGEIEILYDSLPNELVN